MNLKRVVSVLMAGSVMVVMSGCLAVGQKYQFNNIVSDIKTESASEVAVGVQDQRSYILNGDKKPEFVGLMRGGWGNPFKVTTESGKPLSMEITDSIAGSLKQKGFKVDEVEILFSDSQEAGLEKLLAAGKKDKYLFLIVNEWKTDTFVNIGLHYDLTMKIYDSTKAILGEKNIKGKDNLGKSSLKSAKNEALIASTFKTKMEELLNDEKILNSLK